MKLASYRHFSDSELLNEADQFAHDPLITELAKRLAEKIDAAQAYPDCDCDIAD